MASRTAMIKFAPNVHPLSQISDLFYPFGFPPEILIENYEPSEDRNIDHIRTLGPGKALAQFKDSITCSVFIAFHNTQDVYPDLSVEAATDAQMQSILDEERKRKVRGEGEKASVCRLETIMWYDNWRAKHTELDHKNILDFSRLTGETLVKVTKLVPGATKEDIRRLFSTYKVNDVEMGKGAAYMTLGSTTDAERVVGELNGKKVLARAVKVQDLGPSHRFGV